jgi:hypothetical protein
MKITNDNLRSALILISIVVLVAGGKWLILQWWPTGSKQAKAVVPAHILPTTLATVCRMSYTFAGIEYATCVATLISPTALITSAGCDRAILKDKSAEATCGSETLSVRLGQTNPQFDLRDIDFRNENDQKDIDAAVAIYKVEGAKQFARASATMDLNPNGELTDCSIVKFEGLNDQLNAKPSAVASGPLVYDSGDNAPFLATLRVTEALLPGNPMFCKNKDGNDVLRGVMALEDKNKIFFARLRKNKAFIENQAGAR